MSLKTEQDFVRCFAARAAKEARWPDAVKLAKELYGQMRW
jgi:hypothetical protein